jgi:hypothetical protein
MVSGEQLRLVSSTTNGNPYMSFYQTATRRAFIQFHDTNNALTLASEYGEINFKAAATAGVDSDTDYMRIDVGGNVGIGTTTPAGKLDVYSNTSGVYAARIKNDQSTTGHGLYVESDGNTTGSNVVYVNTGSGDAMIIRGDGNVTFNSSNVVTTPSGAPGTTNVDVDGYFYCNTSNMERARVYNSSAISCGHGAYTYLTFNSEHFDHGAIHSTSSNTSRLTAPVNGWYLVGGWVVIAANGAGTRELSIFVNRAAPAFGQHNMHGMLGTYYVKLSTCGILYMSSGQYAELQVYQDSGGALNVIAGQNANGFWMQRVG